MVQVTFTNDYKQATSNPVYQWDYGRKLYIYGLESTDATIQVHFSDRSCERTIVRLATFFPTDNVSNFEILYKVQIPDELLENSCPINAFIYVVDAESGQTTHYINIPVIARKKPAGFISKPNETQTTLLEQGLIDINEANAALIERTEELTDYLNSEVTKIEEYVDAEVTELKTYTDEQIATAKTSAEIGERHYYTSSWGEWICVTKAGGKVLWTGALYMQESHDIALSEAISEQATGIVLVFSRYSSGEAQNYNFNQFFISKRFVALHNGAGSQFLLSSDGTFATLASIYIHKRHFIKRTCK